VTRRRITGIGVGGPLASASVSWEYVDSDDRRRRGAEKGCLVLAGGQLPKVRQVSDPILMGVHPSSSIRGESRGAAGEPLLERVPAYVTRDADDELWSRLSDGGFVLVVGDSSAGKSRAAYQAIATLPDHVLVVPQNRDALGVALDRAAAARRCVLWLDDLENYLGIGGLTRSAVVRLLTGKRAHRVIIATLRAAEETVVTAETAVEEGGWLPRKDAREVLELAHRIILPRMFSPSERERARAQAWDPRIGDALAQADVYGVAEYLAAGPELLRDWENAWSANTDPRAPSHPRGAALIAAAVDVRRGGYTSPLPRVLLEEVHSHYLQQRGGSRLRPEPLDEAWAWATKPRRATTALLHDFDDQHIQVFDYLLDTVQRRSGPGDYPPDSIMSAAISVSAANDADNIASAAYDHGRYQLAEKAWAAAYRIRADDLGPEHADTLSMRAFHANVLRYRRARLWPRTCPGPEEPD
jgi:eukaryotic-like serine/threonine-protein kinase